MQDLAGLLKALYDAVGSSIKIPNNGTKTLKLRLSVGQDGAQGQTMDTAKVKVDKNEKTDSPKKKDLLKNKENVKHKASPKTKKKDITRLNNLTSCTAPLAKCNNETAGQVSSTTKSRLSSKEHQELAELVQENMERNHVRQLRYELFFPCRVFQMQMMTFEQMACVFGRAKQMLSRMHDFSFDFSVI